MGGKVGGANGWKDCLGVVNNRTPLLGNGLMPGGVSILGGVTCSLLSVGTVNQVTQAV